MNEGWFLRVSSLFLVGFALCISFWVGPMPAAGAGELSLASQAGQQPSSSVMQDGLRFTEPREDGLKRFMITFDEPGLMELHRQTRSSDRHRFDIQQPMIAGESSAMTARHQAYISEMSGVLRRELEVSHFYQITHSGVAAWMTLEEARRLAGMGTVRSVERERLYFLETFAGPEFIGAGSVWDGSTTPDGNAYRGEGMIAGVLDSGILPNHPSFINDPACGHGVGGVPDKLISFVDCAGTNAQGLCAGPNPVDVNGHGTHVAGTKAGNAVGAGAVPAPNPPVGSGVAGVAKCASIRNYKVCPGQSCPDADVQAGMNTLLADGDVDTMNFSISGGSSPWNDNDRRKLDLVDAGVFVNASAGNTSQTVTNPVGRVNHRGPWVVSVAASTRPGGAPPGTVSVTGPGTPPGNLQNIPVSPGSNSAIPASVVEAPVRFDPNQPAGADGCTGFPANFFDNAIALVHRGTCAFTDKINNAAAAGAIMVIIRNNQSAPISMNTAGQVSVPAYSMEQVPGDALRDFAAANPTAALRFEADSAPQGDVLAGFSLRGPTPSPLQNLQKPDITAPGVGIYAAYVGADGYGNLSGTSMSGPHLSGAALLVRQMQPDWAPTEVASALRMTAKKTGFKENGSTSWDWDDVGSGRVDLTRAGLAGLVMDETFANFLASNPASGGDVRTLNLPAVRDLNCTPSCTFTRTVRNTLSQPSSWSADFEALSGAFDVTVTPSSFSFTGNTSETQTLTITVAPIGTVPLSFGTVDLVEAGGLSPDLHFTVAVAGTGDGGAPVEGVTGFDFEGTVSGISNDFTWASDLQMTITSPAGATFTVGGFDSGNAVWDFDGAGSDLDGTYSSSHPNVFPSGTPLDGNWALTFVHTYGPGAAMTWDPINIELTGPDRDLLGTLSVPAFTIEGGATASFTIPAGDAPPPADPEIAVEPESLSAFLTSPDSSVQTLTISNIGDATLEWQITQEPASLPISLSLGDSQHEAPTTAGADTNYSLILDDGAGENAIGIGDQWLWLNRFTPASDDFPISLERVEVMFGYSGATGGVNVGELVDIYLYQDADGNPANGADHVASLTGQAVQSVNGSTWSVFNLPSPVVFEGPGDVLIGVVNRTAGVTENTFPAVIDQSSPSQQRSWAGFGVVPGNPPQLPLPTFGIIDSFGAQFAGNWLVRGFGNIEVICDSPADVPWLSVSDSSGSTEAGEQSPINVTLSSAGLDAGIYEARLCISSNDAANPLVVVPVSLEVESGLDPARILVSPPQIDTLAEEGGLPFDLGLNITNVGEDDLEWSFTSGDRSSYGTLLRTGSSASAPPLAHRFNPALEQLLRDPGVQRGETATFALRTPDSGTTLTHSTSFDLVAGNTPVCSTDGGITTRSNAFLRVFSLDDFGILDGFDVEKVTFGIETNSTATTVDVNIYELDGAFVYENLTLIGSATANLPASASTMVEVPIEAFAAPRSTFVVEIQAPNLSGEGAFRPGSNPAGETAPSYTVAPACNINEPTSYGDLGIAGVNLVMSVTGQTNIACSAPSDLDWLSASTTGGVLSGGSSQTVSLTLNAGNQPLGTVLHGNLCVASNDSDNGLVVVPTTLTVVEPGATAPQAVIAPGTIDAVAVEGESTSASITVGNVGNANLRWSIGNIFGDDGVVLSESFSSTTFPPNGWSEYSLSGASELSWRRVTNYFNSSPGSAHRQFSFPGSGFRDDWLVSPRIPVFGITTLTFADAGQFMEDYGGSFVQVSAGSCNPADGDFVTVAEIDDSLEAQWRQGIEVDLTAFANQEICIAFNYTGFFAHSWWVDDVVVTSGVPDPDATAGCYDFDEENWLAVSPQNGIINPSAQQSLSVSLNSDGLDPGLYVSDLCLFSNDVGANPARIPVVFDVLEFNPIADISPNDFSFEVFEGRTANDDLLIGNLGTSPLFWNVDTANLLPGLSYAEALDRDFSVPALPIGWDRASGVETQGEVDHVFMGADFGRAVDGLIEEGFDNVGLLPSRGWILINQSQPVGTTAWFQGNPGVFSAFEGEEDDSYIAANFANAAGSGLINNWLLTPETVLRTGTEIRFYTRSLDAVPDRLEVRYSTAGNSVNVGTSASDVGDFGNLVASVNPNLVSGGYPTEWTEVVVRLEGLPEPVAGRVALRYFVEDGGPEGSNSNYIGIDSFKITQPIACEFPGTIDWLTMSFFSGGGNGVTQPGSVSRATLNVDTDGLALGDYEARVCVTTNDPNAELVEIPVSLTVVGIPVAEVDPQSLAFVANAGDTDSGPLTISNVGTADLVWDIETAPWGISAAGAYGETAVHAEIRDGAEVYAGPGDSSTRAFSLPEGASRAAGRLIDASMPFDAEIQPVIQAGPIAGLSEGFSDVSALPGLGWALINRSQPAGNTGWFQGNPVLFDAHEGGPDSYIAANFQNTSGSGTISNWLLTPEVVVENGTRLRFWSRSTGDGFADRLEVRLSTNGDSVNVGSTATEVGDFTTLMLTINEALDPFGYPDEWTQYEVTVTGLDAPTSGRFALRYFVTSGGPAGDNSDLIAIDTLSIEPAPVDFGRCDSPAAVDWLSVSQSSGTTAVGQSSQLTVSANTAGLSGGVYEATLCISTNEPDGVGLVQVPVTFEVIDRALAEISPSSFVFDLVEGQTDTGTINIENVGQLSVDWSLNESVRGTGGGELLFSNGPLVTNPGAGPNGADLSVVQTALGLTTFGSANQLFAPGPHFRMADEMVIDGIWNIDTMSFFVYQTGSPTTSSITGVNVEIWDGPPNEAGSSVIFGDRTTNRLQSTRWSNAYRVLDSALTNTQRPIMEVVADMSGLELNPGTYWVSVQTAGSIASGPWLPPVSIPGQTTTGSALQLTSTGWAPLVDGGTSTGQGMPFEVRGSSIQCLAPGDIPWLSVAPESGSVAPAAVQNATLTVDSSGLLPGSNEVSLCVFTNDATRPVVPISVRLDVSLAADTGIIEGNVQSLGYCGVNPFPAAGATITVEGPDRVLGTTVADDEGRYALIVSTIDSPVTVSASAPDHTTRTETDVDVGDGLTSTVDFDLVLEQACASVTPDSLELAALSGNTATGALSIGNLGGGAALEWNLSNATPGERQRATVSLFSEDFEGTFPPQGWTTQDATGLCPWLSSDDYGLFGFTGTGRGAAVDSDDCGQGTTADASLVSPALDLTDARNTMLSFNLAYRHFGGSRFRMDVSVDGSEWTTLQTWSSDFGRPASAPVSIDLSDYDGQSEVYLRWRYTSGWDWWAFVDNVVVTSDLPCYDPAVDTWLTVSQGGGTVEIGGESALVLTADTDGITGPTVTTLCITTNDDQASLFEIPVQLDLLSDSLFRDRFQD